MKIMFVGDCDLNTGPSNVNKEFKKILSDRVSFFKFKIKILRAIETVIKVLKSDVIIISGISYINNLALKEAVFFKKKIIYIMHGYYAYEEKLNKFKHNEKKVKNEEYLLEKADKIITVSEKYMRFILNYFPNYKEKLTFINNGIDWKQYENIKIEKERDPYLIVSMGGGRPQKNNLIICEAVTLLNEKYNFPFKFVVLGRDYEDTVLIKQNKYTNYVGQVSREKVKEWLKKSSIYIQNSSFESFGLAPIEALCTGCNLLVSNNVGAISILNTIKEEDIIKNYKNPDEIAKKIINIFNNPNNNRLLSGINKRETSCEYASDKLLKICLEVYNGN